MKVALAFFVLLGFAVSATAQPTPRWKLELTPESAVGLEEVYSGCAIPLHDGRVMYVSPTADFNRIQRETWMWDNGWQLLDTSSESPRCKCASATFDTASREPVVISKAFEPEGMRISRWRDGQWHHVDIPAAELSLRSDPAILWDESRQALLITGGQTQPDEARDGACLQDAEGAARSCYRETWSYDGDTWTLLDDGCGPDPHPGCSPDGAAWDPVSGRPRLVDIQRDRVQLFEFTDRWRLVDESTEFLGGDLRCLNTTNLAFDPRNGNWVGFGGIDTVLDGVTGDYFGFWGWSEVGGWQPFLHRPKDLDPAGQEGARLAYLHDPERFLMFGGHTLNDRYEATNETWFLEMRRRGPFGGTGSGGCCATTGDPGREGILFVLLALIGFRRFTRK